MKKAIYTLLYLLITTSSGILLTGCQMITYAFDEMPVKASLVVFVAAVVITAIIVFLVRMGSRQGDEKAEA